MEFRCAAPPDQSRCPSDVQLDQPNRLATLRSGSIVLEPYVAGRGIRPQPPFSLGEYSPRVRTILGLAAAAITLSACSPSGPSTRELTNHGEVAPIEVGWSEVSPVEDVELPTGKLLSGQAVQPEAGQPVLINFWASTCPRCRREMPLLQELSDSGDAVVIGVTRDRFAKYANQAIERAGVTYPNFQDPKQDYEASFHGVVPLGPIPVSVVVVDGKAIRIHLGPFEDLADLRAGLPG